jgi:hypothetical protein
MAAASAPARRHPAADRIAQRADDGLSDPGAIASAGSPDLAASEGSRPPALRQLDPCGDIGAIIFR